MTTNQTIDGVPLASLELLLGDIPDHPSAAWKELRALLDAPAVGRKPYAYAHEWAGWISTEGPKDFKAVIEREAPPQWAVESGQARNVIPLYDVPAAQPQGEPVAYADPKAFENFGSLAHLGGLYAREWMWAKPATGLVPLYAEQPAPVAVVPERLAQVLKFLEGAENLDGYWFGEPGPHGSKVWWRAELRKALAETNLFAKQQ